MAPPYFFCAFLLLRIARAVRFDALGVAAVAAVWVLQFASESAWRFTRSCKTSRTAAPCATGVYLRGVFVVPKPSGSGRSCDRRGPELRCVTSCTLGPCSVLRWKISGSTSSDCRRLVHGMGALVSTQSRFGDNAVVDLKGAPSPPAALVFLRHAHEERPLSGRAPTARSSSRDADTVGSPSAKLALRPDSMGWAYVTKQLRLRRWTPVEVFEPLGSSIVLPFT